MQAKDDRPGVPPRRNARPCSAFPAVDFNPARTRSYGFSGPFRITSPPWEDRMKKTIAMIAAAAAVITLNAAKAAPLPEAAPDDVGFSKRGLARLDDFFAREIATKRVPAAVVAI